MLGNPLEITEDGGIIINTSDLPKGLWFDAEKQKFRVRLYANKTVVHLKYHETLEAALLDWAKAIHKENKEEFLPKKIIPNTYKNLIDYLKYGE